MMVVQTVWGPLSSLLFAILWAVCSSYYGSLTESYSAIAVNFTRTYVGALGFLVLYILLYYTSSTMPGWAGISGTAWMLAVISIVSSYGIGDTLFMQSIRYLGLSTSLAIVGTVPVWSTIGFFILEQAMPSLWQWFGLLCACGGLMALVLHQDVTPQQDMQKRLHKGFGIGLALVAAWLFAINGIALHRMSIGLPVVVTNLMRMVLGVFLIPSLYVLWQWFSKTILRYDAPMVLWIPRSVVQAYAGVFIAEAVGGSFLISYGFANAPMALAATLTALSPVIAHLILVFQKKEPFSYIKALSIMSIILGIYFLSM